MAVIDLTLRNFSIPNFPSLIPPFGTKKPEEGEGLSSIETHRNIAMGFQRQRPVTISENSETTAVEADATIVLAGAVSELALGNGAFIGCRVILINKSGHKVKLIGGDSAQYIYANKTLELFWMESSWESLIHSIVGSHVFTAISDPVELSRRRWLLLDGRVLPILPDYDELVDVIWRGVESNGTVETYYRCDEDGTRNAGGGYFKFPDGRGRVIRSAGRGDPVPDKDGLPIDIANVLYDGKDVGDRIDDGIRNIKAGFGGLPTMHVSAASLVSGSGTFSLGGGVGYSGVDPFLWGFFGIDTSLTLPTSPWNRDASLSANMCLVY
ncbi:hypothetical protein [Breznakiella homolactica]|uniref:Uncharacterized protein n=1 Tax=Breznakiella homolactica TaxID=2798577 RepID=A0A7T7XPP4_9SPIR|nr:hypothetical protein [Breznakiella homolactica]QQO10102.1 hypothetical protein JFL75_04065 [Breznakiella homolactica]